MTCRSARQQMPDLFDTPDNPELREHLAACGACAAEFEETLNALTVIQPGVRVSASPDFKQRVIWKLAAESRPAPAPARRFPLLVAAATALALLLALPYLGSLGTDRTATTLLAQSVEALRGIQSVHIQARMRTLPGDNFEF